MTPVAVCWIDHQYDRQNASDGSSRFGDHLNQHVARFSGMWGDIAPVNFACTAWDLATSPSLEPGFVRFHRRVLSARCVRNSWDGTMSARVLLVGQLPAALTSDRVWNRDRGWRGWPQTFGQFVTPNDQDVSRDPHIRSTLHVDAPIPLGELPPTPDAPTADLLQLVERAVTVLARELNELLSPVVGALETFESA